jgi:hypothetical protein
MYFYQKSYLYSVAPQTNNQTAGVLLMLNGGGGLSNYFYVGYNALIRAMRATPTLNIYSFSSSAKSVVSDCGGKDQPSASGVPSMVNNQSFAVQNSSGKNINSAYGGFMCHWTAECEL